MYVCVFEAEFVPSNAHAIQRSAGAIPYKYTKFLFPGCDMNTGPWRPKFSAYWKQHWQSAPLIHHLLYILSREVTDRLTPGKDRFLALDRLQPLDDDFPFVLLHVACGRVSQIAFEVVAFV